MSWIDIRERSPIDISGFISHAQKFNYLVGVRITSINLNGAKKSLIDARGELDLMFTTLQQTLYDRTILQGRTDEVLYGWLIDNLGRYLKTLDEKEEDILNKMDTINREKSNLSPIFSYARLLKISQSVIYESLLKSIEEFEKIEESEEIKKEPRTFLYILFNVLQTTFSSIGGIARKGSGSAMGKKGQVSSLPTTWQSLMSKDGQNKITKNYGKEKGENVSVEESMIESNSEDFSETDENTLFCEENIEEDEN